MTGCVRKQYCQVYSYKNETSNPPISVEQCVPKIRPIARCSDLQVDVCPLIPNCYLNGEFSCFFCTGDNCSAPETTIAPQDCSSVFDRDSCENLASCDWDGSNIQCVPTGSVTQAPILNCSTVTTPLNCSSNCKWVSNNETYYEDGYCSEKGCSDYGQFNCPSSCQSLQGDNEFSFICFDNGTSPNCTLLNDEKLCRTAGFNCSFTDTGFVSLCHESSKPLPCSSYSLEDLCAGAPQGCQFRPSLSPSCLPLGDIPCAAYNSQPECNQAGCTYEPFTQRCQDDGQVNCPAVSGSKNVCNFISSCQYDSNTFSCLNCTTNCESIPFPTCSSYTDPNQCSLESDNRCTIAESGECVDSPCENIFSSVLCGLRTDDCKYISEANGCYAKNFTPTCSIYTSESGCIAFPADSDPSKKCIWNSGIRNPDTFAEGVCADPTKTFSCSEYFDPASCSAAGCFADPDTLQYCRATNETTPCFQFSEEGCSKNLDRCEIQFGTCAERPPPTTTTTTTTMAPTLPPCEEGFSRKGNETDCTDINECLDKAICTSSRTGQFSFCNNTIGSFECLCNPGYSNEPPLLPFCKRDECNNATLNNCSANARCIEQDIEYSCECNSGFAGDGFNCTDLCEINNGNCGANQSCTVDSRFNRTSCSCPTGYEGRECTNINECDTTFTCFSSASDCVDTDGSFRCDCKDGYIHPEGDSVNCVNVDDCLVDNGGCDALVQCFDNPIPPGVTCDRCPLDYSGDSSVNGGCVLKECSLDDLSSFTEQTMSTDCDSPTIKAKSNCTVSCKPGYASSVPNTVVSCQGFSRGARLVFSGNFISCEPIRCGALDASLIENAADLGACNSQPNSNPINATCSLTCDAGFEVVGENATCVQDPSLKTQGVWTSITQTCRACPSGTWSTRGAPCVSHKICLPGQEFETVAPTPTSDRFCQNLTVCRQGSEKISKPASPTSDRLCFRTNCCPDPSSQYSTSLDVCNCVSCTQTCPEGQYKNAVCTQNADASCVLARVCPVGQYETRAPSRTIPGQNRECTVFPDRPEEGSFFVEFTFQLTFSGTTREDDAFQHIVSAFQALFPDVAIGISRFSSSSRRRTTGDVSVRLSLSEEELKNNDILKSKASQEAFDPVSAVNQNAPSGFQAAPSSADTITFENSKGQKSAGPQNPGQLWVEASASVDGGGGSDMTLIVVVIVVVVCCALVIVVVVFSRRNRNQGANLAPAKYHSDKDAVEMGGIAAPAAKQTARAPIKQCRPTSEATFYSSIVEYSDA